MPGLLDFGHQVLPPVPRPCQRALLDAANHLVRHPAQPLLLIVYDSPSGVGNKAACPPVFELNGADSAAAPRVTNRGKYYKNVRSEWASLVATPP